MESPQRETTQSVHQWLAAIRASVEETFHEGDELHKHVVDWFDALLISWFMQCKAAGRNKSLRIDDYLVDYRTLLVNADGLQYRLPIYALAHWSPAEQTAARWFGARGAM